MRYAVSTDGVEVPVYDFAGLGPPLLLAHATGFHGHVLAPLAHRLGDRFHCYAFDERGHGDARTPKGTEFNWRGFADDALAALDSVGLEHPFGFGHSAGGAALLMAEQLRPGAFRAIVCYEPIVIPVAPPLGRSDNPLSEGARRRREVFPSRDDAYENFASKPPFSVLHPEVLRAYVDHGFSDEEDGSVRLKCHRDDEAEVYRGMGAHEAFGRLGEVHCPVTIACGEHTDAIGPAVVERQAAALPDATTHVIPGLGHFGPLQDPDAVAALVVKAFAAVT